MAIKTNFTQNNSYNAVDLVNEFAALFNDGVCSGGSVSQHSPANLSVDVSAVKCIKSGMFLNSDSTVNVTINANTSGYNRIDVIAVDLDNNNIISVQGTPNSSPTAPILTGNKIALVNIFVGNNVSVINTSNITDVRVNADVLNGSLASKADKGKVGKISAFSWSGTIANNGATTITHNLGYNPIVCLGGTRGNLQLTFCYNDLNSITVSNFSGGGNAWTGQIYFW